LFDLIQSKERSMWGLYSNVPVPRLEACVSNPSPAVTARTFTRMKSAPVSVILIAKVALVKQ
jgi:hypothetical protein